MNIVCCFDDNYVMPTGVLLLSVCENNKREKEIIFYAISEELKEENRRILKKIVEPYERKIHFYCIDAERFKNSPIQKEFQDAYLKVSTYYRLFLASVLPANLDKVLYLDTDMVVFGSLAGLWNTDIDTCALSAAIEYLGDSVWHSNRLDCDFPLGYFNAGVLLINMVYWRENNIENELLEYAERNAKVLQFHDQDTLNYVLRDRRKEMPMKYNVVDSYLRETKNLYIKRSRWDEMFSAVKTPIIIHFTGEIKPWHKDSNLFFDSIWLKYYRLSPWKDVPLTYKQTFLKRQMPLLKRLLAHFGLVSVPDYKYRTNLPSIETHK